MMKAVEVSMDDIDTAGGELMNLLTVDQPCSFKQQTSSGPKATAGGNKVSIIYEKIFIVSSFMCICLIVTVVETSQCSRSAVEAFE